MTQGDLEQHTELHTDEAVLLAHALVARLAEKAAARALFIKGPTAVALGVRPARPSGDVDVLVEPASFEAVCRAMESAGWQLRSWLGALRYAGEFAFDHSAHYIHPEWPCDVDVHYNFPGFLADPAAVFDALWSRRIEVEIAGRQVQSPDHLGQALVVALHALRDPERPQSRADLAHIAAAADDWPPTASSELADLAAATGAAGSAAPLLAALGTAAADDPSLAPRLADWHARQRGFGRSTMWLVELRRTPWKDRPATLRRALVPPPEYLVSSHEARTLTRSRLWSLHARRWARGLVSLPRALARFAGLR
ncbi:nucleotidyltransferase family protein [Pedococcus sp. NPDC057267]|uniref:nucleotidyltransferase family protein n=1 Tax=Pedococcus sp. NPDC057267 TaxID=3346077 RepID=UPI003627DE87